ncbi:RidA family protein [Limibacillus sp. MBR-115]|jgi:enamine deaminase RidA (YjgF/YER057c/UK114 family)|uniref:RidA family protein n=1 Tax=Limibacillus sp. MBR-115 TaxID=3156465 RepID=UPI0033948B5D
MNPQTKLREAGLVLPSITPMVEPLVHCVRDGDLLYLSGKGPKTSDGSFITGKVGAGITVEEAYDHARSVGLLLLAACNAELGSLDRIQRVIKLLGFVNAAPTFTDHAKVVNGCSDLMVLVFGKEDGRHARSAIGAGSLPNGITVEVEAIFRVR